MRALQRGASPEEIAVCIREEPATLLEGNRRQSAITLPFHNQSPVNQKFYSFKRIEVIFVEEEREIVVVTIKVLYFDREQSS